VSTSRVVTVPQALDPAPGASRQLYALVVEDAPEFRGLIASLMLVGIRMKLPPPDPEWRKHQPPQSTPPTRIQLIVFFGGRFAVWIAALVAAAFHANRLALALMLVYFVLILTWIGMRVQASRRARRAAAPAPNGELL
jgi:hypothetical protein